MALIMNNHSLYYLVTIEAEWIYVNKIIIYKYNIIFRPWKLSHYNLDLLS